MSCCDWNWSEKWKWSWLFNGIIMILLTSLIVILEFDVIPFPMLGFQCKDPSLSHKYKGDTIPFMYLIAVTILVPLIVIFLVEFLVIKLSQSYVNPEAKKIAYVALYWYGQFFLGLCILLFVVQLAKSIIAEPRPHFFDTCKPDKFNCTSGYITDYKCLNTEMSHRDVRDSFRSFPSGHSALGLYVGIFLVWFCQMRIPHTDYLIVPCLQCIFITWAIVCALTRITDRRHHWWDVLVGSIFGIIMAAFTVRVFCRDFFSTQGRKQDKNLNEMGNNVGWDRRFPFGASSSGQDGRELREVK